LELESLSSVFFLSLQSLAILFLSFSTWDREKVLFEDKFKIQKVKLKDYKKFDLELKKRSEFEEENRNLVKRNINAAKSLIETQERFKKTQDELNQAQKELIQAQKLSSLGAMISGISHEINNPVNYIGTTSYILKNELSKLNEYLNSMIEDQSDAALEFKRELESKFFLLNKSIQNIESGVQKVSEINTALRNYSRLDEFPTRDILIEELFEEALTILGAQIKFFKINKNYLNGAKAFCRRSHISQVICNLIINANDALLEKKELLEDPEFQGEITLSCKYLKDPDKDWVVFEIEDNGQGISDFAKDNIFQAFFTTKEVGKGTGLGLTICHKIIKDHDGKIEIDSSPSLGGARFKIYLPIPALENLDLEDI